MSLRDRSSDPIAHEQPVLPTEWLVLRPFRITDLERYGLLRDEADTD